MTSEIVKRYSAPVPRYTSYPTAPHFSDAVGHKEYAAWLTALTERARLSLYLHIPFCDAMCWYCGCSTKAVRRYEPVANYLQTLMAEIAGVSSRVPRTHRVTHIHWGGGSPNVLSSKHISDLAEGMRTHFNVGDDAEFAIEVDPRGLSGDRIAAFAQASVTRVSIGVQDFDPKVQAAINRLQSFETTKRVVEMFREQGIAAINIDLVYGLPHQTRDSVTRTIKQVLALEPNRIATFGYAHLPSRLKHQRVIDQSTLPDVVERFAQSNRLVDMLAAAGYVRIGLDHFARADDPLSTGPVRRNFQGYTSDAADALIGLGASAIGRLPEGYAQNSVPVADYERRINEHGLATARGVALTPDDRMRAFVIERLMCDLLLPATELRRRYGQSAALILEEAAALIEADQDRLVERDGDGFRITPRGRPFVRTIAACFDTYLGAEQARHSLGV
ncbi:MAG: oxygen-independent coproporphyrinogen III oxidase [Hyphomicrobium sp.]|nr:oxygen-independent coproporphyrinogen III oxidase [Hyphomicrobium sp.]